MGTGYNRTDTTNNIATGNIINASDLDAEYDAIDAAFDETTGHDHGGASGNGAPITKVGPVQDLVVSASAVTPKTTNTLDLGTSILKFKDFNLAGNALIAGTLGVTGVATLTAKPILSSLTASQAVFSDGSKGLVSNAITGTGNVVMSASPTLTGTITAADITASGNIVGNGNWTLGNADTDTITVGASFVTGSVLRSAKVATNTLALAAYDVDGTAYTNLITLTASNTPTLALTSTGVGTINNMSIGATTASTGAFTTLSASGVATFSAGTVSLPAITTTGNTNTGIFFPAADTIAFTEGGAEAMRITSAGDVGIGITAPTAKLHVTNTGAGNSFLVEDSTNPDATPFVVDNIGNVLSGITTAQAIGSATPQVQLHSTTASNVWDSYSNFNWSASTQGSGIVLAKSRSGTIGTNGIVSSGDNIGLITFYGDDGADFIAAATIRGMVDGTPGTNDMPGRLVFSTTADGASTVTERMRIDSAGNVGIGTVSPTNYGANYKTLDIKGTTQGSLVLGHGSTNDFIAYGAASESGLTVLTATPLIFGTNSTERMRIDSSGNVLVGTTSPTYSAANRGDLEVYGSTDSVIAARSSSGACYIYNSSSGMDLFTTINGYMRFLTNSTERMRIDSSGNLCIAKSSATTAGNGMFFQPGGEIFASISSGSNTYHVWSTTSSTFRFYVNENGGIQNFSGNNVNLSDERSKKNIEVAGSYLGKICSIPVKLFNYNEEAEDEQKTLGVIAQDVEAVAPELVSNAGWEGKTAEDGTALKGIYTQDIVFALMKSIQEQQVMIEKLTTRLNALESK
jgi:hypothetical protein